jgi:hypothetical protein
MPRFKIFAKKSFLFETAKVESFFLIYLPFYPSYWEGMLFWLNLIMATLEENYIIKWEQPVLKLV